MGRARRHLDVRFFWRLLEALPAAEAVAGDFDEAVADIQRLSARFDDLTDSGRGEVAEMLRPLYLEYLRSAAEGDGRDGTEDLGAPVSALAVPEGVPVYDRAGQRAGVVDRVMIDEATGIFEGVIIHTRPVVPGRHLFADHEQIAELRERGVDLAVTADELHAIGPERRRRDDGRPESPLEAALRKAWDWVSGVR